MIMLSIEFSTVEDLNIKKIKPIDILKTTQSPAKFSTGSYLKFCI